MDQTKNVQDGSVHIQDILASFWKVSADVSSIFISSLWGLVLLNYQCSWIQPDVSDVNGTAPLTGPVSGGAEQLGFRSLVEALTGLQRGSFGFQHLPEWVCEEMSKNRLE